MSSILRILYESFGEDIPSYEEFSPLIKEKIHFIEDIYDEAYLHLMAKKALSSGVPDLDADLKAARQFVKEGTPGWLTTFPPQGAELISAEKNEELWPLTLPGYEPSPDLWHLAEKLIELWFYWNDLVPPIPDEDCLDLSLMKIAFKIGVETATIRDWGKKKEGIARRNLERKAKSMTKEVEILNAFHAVPKKKGDFLNCIIDRIYNYLKKSVGKKTIERCIKGNAPLMNKCFQKEERGERHRIVYIRHTGV